jgi:uncharacterized protein YndB with AHSA1/START domain
MTNLQPQTVPAVVLRRTYPASRERVFAAWTTPETAARLFSAGEAKAVDVEMDVRPGGTYKMTMLMPNGERWNLRGTYREVRPAERLVMTWRWEEDKPEDEVETLLTLEFHERNGGTELVLTHENFLGAESRDNHEKGWNEILDRLASLA